jgi:hypothetical protein
VRPAARSPSPASRERGTKGVRATQRACPFTLALGKTAPAAEIPCQAVVPLSGSAFPLSRLAGEGDKGGEGNTARLPVHACAGKNSPCCRDSVPSRCTLVRGDKGGEGNTARLPVHACAGKKSPCCRDSVPSRCTLVSCVPPSPARRERGMWSAEAELLQAAEANASATPKALARGSPLPLCGRGAGGEGDKKCACPAHSELKRCTLIRFRKGRGRAC